MSKNDPDLTTEPPQCGEESQGLLGSTRRKFVASGTATWASVSLAGCLGDDDDGTGEGRPVYVVTDEVVAGSEGIPEGAGGFVTSGQAQRSFVPGMQAVFKVGVWDPETGDIVSDNTLTEANVSLDTGDDVELEFASTDREWTGEWMIPEDQETGTVGYTVEVSNDADFTDVGIAQNELEIIEFDPQVANYVVTVDTIAYDDRGGGLAQSCLPQHNFTADMAVGFDVGVYDGGSGEIVGPDIVDEAVIEFADDDLDAVELEWDDEDEYWSAAWRGIPEDFVGTIEYEVVVTNEGEFHNVGIYGDSLEIIEEPDTDAADPASNYVVTAETIAHDTSPDGFSQSCLPQHNFTPDMAVGFAIGVWDGSTGDAVGDDTVDEATIEFEAGDPDSIELEWEPPEDDEEHGYWDGTWRGIPDDYEGELSFEVEVTNDGEFNDVGIYSGSVQIIQG